jgi:glycosyltransferase involved in cell wall biosynthesis
MDYIGLAGALGADILDYAALEAEAGPPVVRIARQFGRDAGLAALAYSRLRDYDVIYSNSESVSIPLGLLLKRAARRPGHLMIGHRLTPKKKRPFLRAIRKQVDIVFVYASPQRDYAIDCLGYAPEQVRLVPFHADDRFYRPMPPSQGAPERMICSAGLEWRDYPTLIEAVSGLDVQVALAAASPWSKHRNETAGRELPPNVSARPYEYVELRQLYADARFVVVPLYENDFQAGITTILEAMAMGKTVIVTRTIGQIDTIVDGRNGLYAPPGDAAALRAAIVRLLDQPDEASRLGERARADVEQDLSLEHWIERIACAARDVYAARLAGG